MTETGRYIRGKPVRTFTYKGETRTFAEWAEISGLHKECLVKRAEAGAKNFLAPLMVRTKAVAVVYGESMTLHEISDLFEIPYPTLLGWRRKGFNIEDKIEERKELNASKFKAD